MSKQKFNGQIDQFGFPYLMVSLINPETKKAIRQIKAIVDTGAAHSCIKQFVIDAINLIPIRKIKTNHIIDGKLDTGIFNVNILFNDFITVPNIEARLLHLEEYPSDFIIGLDIIKHCDFHYDSVQKSFSFHLFPTSDAPNL